MHHSQSKKHRREKLKMHYLDVCERQFREHDAIQSITPKPMIRLRVAAFFTTKKSKPGKMRRQENRYVQNQTAQRVWKMHSLGACGRRFRGRDVIRLTTHKP